MLVALSPSRLSVLDKLLAFLRGTDNPGASELSAIAGLVGERSSHGTRGREWCRIDDHLLEAVDTFVAMPLPAPHEWFERADAQATHDVLVRLRQAYACAYDDTQADPLARSHLVRALGPAMRAHTWQAITALTDASARAIHGATPFDRSRLARELLPPGHYSDTFGQRFHIAVIRAGCLLTSVEPSHPSCTAEELALGCVFDIAREDAIEAGEFNEDEYTLAYMSVLEDTDYRFLYAREPLEEIQDRLRATATPGMAHDAWFEPFRARMGRVIPHPGYHA